MIKWLIPLFFLILFELVADVFAKEWSVKGLRQFWVSAILAYVIGNVFWLYSIRHGSGLARGAIIFSVGSALAAVALGIGIYKEQFSKMQLIGVIFGIISLILISWQAP